MHTNILKKQVRLSHAKDSSSKEHLLFNTHSKKNTAIYSVCINSRLQIASCFPYLKFPSFFDREEKSTCGIDRLLPLSFLKICQSAKSDFFFPNDDVVTYIRGKMVQKSTSHTPLCLKGQTEIL